jgi:5-methylcytosine-specific restriction endonuclease McrA
MTSTALIPRSLRTETGLVEVSQRPHDGYINVTQICKAVGKLVGHWNDLDGTAEYLAAASPVIGITITELIQTIRGGFPELQGTWAHPLVAVEIARWCSPAFAVQVNFWYLEWIQGNLPPPKPMTVAEAVQASLACLATAVDEETRRNDTQDRRLEIHDQQFIEVKTQLGARMTKMLKRWQRLPTEETFDQMRELLWEFSGGKCLRCCLQMTFVDGHRHEINIDEVNPCCAGGWRNWENIQPLCTYCNRIKHEHRGACWDFRPKHPEFLAMRDRYLADKERRHIEHERQLSFWLE